MSNQNPLPSAPQPGAGGNQAEQAGAFLAQAPVELPQVIIPGGRITITESATNLFQAIAAHRQLFYRGGVVVELVHDSSRYSVEILEPVAAQSRFEKYVRFRKLAAGPRDAELVNTNITEAIAKQYLKSEACRNHLPKLNGVLHCPLLVEVNGRLHRVQNGYDETTGLFVASNYQAEAVTLNQAVTILEGVLKDFDFVTPGDKSRAIASLLTPALKLGSFLTGPVPVDVAEANASQSGKTYRQKLVAAVYNQNLAVVTKKAGGVGSMEETFSDHLVKGKVFIQFDNVRGKLDSQYLESFLTATSSFSARIPYHGSVTIDPSKFIVFISSNGFEATKDLTNRASIIRIRKRENHHYRLRDGKDLLQLLFEWQPTMIGCVFAVIEAWVAQGKPRTTETRHDFREWCQVLDWIVQNIFHAAPLMDGHDEAKQRAASPQLTFLRTVAVKLNERQRLNQEISASDIADLCLEEDIEIPGLAADNQTIEEGRMRIGAIMGKLFGEGNELNFDEFRVVREAERMQTLGENYQTLRRYTFSLANAPHANTPVTHAAQGNVGEAKAG